MAYHLAPQSCGSGGVATTGWLGGRAWGGRKANNATGTRPERTTARSQLKERVVAAPSPLQVTKNNALIISITVGTLILLTIKSFNEPSNPSELDIKSGARAATSAKRESRACSIWGVRLAGRAEPPNLPKLVLPNGGR